MHTTGATTANFTPHPYNAQVATPILFKGARARRIASPMVHMAPGPHGKECPRRTGTGTCPIG